MSNPAVHKLTTDRHTVNSTIFTAIIFQAVSQTRLNTATAIRVGQIGIEEEFLVNSTNRSVLLSYIKCV